VEEFKVKTSNFSAEYGRSAGYTVNTTIKSGTNAYHGACSSFFATTLSMPTTSFPTTRRPIAKFRQNQFGGTSAANTIPALQRPRRSFFFFDYQGTELRQADSSASSMSLLPHIGKAISQAPRPKSTTRDARPRPKRSGHIDPFPGNIIPQAH